MRRSWFVGGMGLASVLLPIVGSIGFGFDPKSQPDPASGLGLPYSNLRASELARFNVGSAQFFEVEDLAGGLGPVFNESSCVTCHIAGAHGGAGTILVTRFGREVKGEYDPMIEFGGPIIQSQGIGLVNGVNFVGEVVPQEATIVAHRRTVPLFGLGLVDAIPATSIALFAQREAANNPPTAGVPSYLIDLGSSQQSIGRFGWKAQHATLFNFAGDAYFNELGVTTPLIPDENCPQGDCALLAANPAQTNPNDLDNSSIQALADYITFLAPPARGTIGANETAGEALFASIGCTDCHRPTWQTGPSPTKALNNVQFSPYSDFLLHDMGSLGDGIVQNQAGPTQFRTPPLWGLRYQPSLLHDGRTTSISTAILMHDGQGAKARNRFASLNSQKKAQLIDFLNSL